MTNMRFLTYLAPILVLVGGVSGKTASPEGTKNVRELLDRQVAAWNRGDLEGYMAGYWKSDQLSFFSNGKKTLGWRPTLEHYRERYQKNKTGMGKVTLKVELEQLDEDLVLGRGEWSLIMPDGSTPHGLTTLIVRKMPEGWRIVHDHSCSE
jgi:beta-aspartyl-peptidase (threonine type)